MNFLLIFIGGGLGSICRYGIARWLPTTEGGFPTATFLANVLSCVILGMLFGYHFKSGMSDQYRLVLMTGFCGGFSTFSTFSLETFSLFQNGDYGYALANIGFSVAVCLVCIFIGIKIMS